MASKDIQLADSINGSEEGNPQNNTNQRQINIQPNQGINLSTL